MYGEYDRSLGAKIVLTVIQAIAVCAAGWILFGSGFGALFRWTGKTAAPDHNLTSALVFACAAVYFARICYGTVHLYKRKVGYGEALGIGVWVAFIHVLFAFFGRTNAKPFEWGQVAGIFFYVLGSYFNTGSEYLRYRWKENPRNKDRLYTGGLFRYSRHINYFGDELLFLGYALIAGSLWGLAIPALMAFGFVFANIPMLDGYLKKKYGGQFDTYAAHTRKFIPYVY
jgi:protein-S-isoprenylcysteine O-methyltransferase Ste14